MHLRAKSVAMTLLCGAAMAASPVWAVTYDYDFTGADHNSTDFSLVGNASWASDGALSPPNRLRLTSNGGGQVGNAWVNTGSVDAGQAWSAAFTWQITFGVGGGADGLGFHVHENGTAANTFFNGAGLSTPYLSVGIDTFDNAEGSAFHVEVHRDGSQIGREGARLPWDEPDVAPRLREALFADGGVEAVPSAVGLLLVQ